MIIVIATIECREDCIELMKKELCKLTPYTKREFGCIGYNFYQDKSNETYFNSYEIWMSQEDINNHLNTKYIKEFFENTKPYLTNFKIREMKQIC